MHSLSWELALRVIKLKWLRFRLKLVGSSGTEKIQIQDLVLIRSGIWVWGYPWPGYWGFNGWIWLELLKVSWSCHILRDWVPFFLGDLAALFSWRGKWVFNHNLVLLIYIISTLVYLLCRHFDFFLYRVSFSLGPPRSFMCFFSIT